MAINKSLKIGVIIDQLLPGGVQLTAIEQVKQLNKLGHKAKLLILMRKKYPQDFSYLVKDVPFAYLSDYYPWPFRKTVKFPIFSFLSTLHLLSPIFITGVIKENQYDIVLSHGTTTCLSSQALWRKRKIPYIAYIHDPMIYILEICYRKTYLKYFFGIIKPLARYLEKSFVRDAAKTIIVSEVHLGYLKKNYHITPDILAHGCKPLVKIPARRGNAVLSFGRWQKEKNPVFLLQLAALMPKADFIIAGNWLRETDRADFETIIKKYNLSGRVRLIPDYTESGLADICASSRVWIHPHPEAFSLSSLEAAGHGLPIIIPKGSGITEIFSHGVHGYFPGKVSLKEYKKYVELLLNNPTLAKKMGIKAWQLAKEQYSWEAHAKKLTALLYPLIPKMPDITALELSHAGGTGLSGGDKLLEEMAKRIKADLTIEVVTSAYGANHWRESGLPVIVRKLSNNGFDGKTDPISVFLSYLIRIYRASKLLIDNKYNIRILYSSTNILPDVLPAYITKLFNPGLVWIGRVHHLIPPPGQRQGLLVVNIVSYLMQSLALYCLKSKADTTIALNSRLYWELHNSGFLKKKLAILGAGIDYGQIVNYRPERIPKFEAIFLGRLHIAKGIYDTIGIWREVVGKIPRARLGIIGAGPKNIQTKVKQEIVKQGLSQNIKILGYLSRSKVYDYLKSAGVFVFTDHEAGWGMAIAEAMACKLPVIGYDIGVFGDVYKKGYQTVPLGRKDMFAGKIIDILSDTRKRDRLSMDAFNQAGQLNWDKTNREFLRLLQSSQK